MDLDSTSLARRRDGRSSRRFTDTERAKHQNIYEGNQRKLDSFLSGEKKVKRKEVFDWGVTEIPSQIIEHTRYENALIEGFVAHVHARGLLGSETFEPKIELQNYLVSSVGDLLLSPEHEVKQLKSKPKRARPKKETPSRAITSAATRERIWCAWRELKASMSETSRVSMPEWMELVRVEFPQADSALVKRVRSEVHEHGRNRLKPESAKALSRLEI